MGNICSYLWDMRYNNKQEKEQRVAELTANVPVGTRMDVMSNYNRRMIAECVVEKVTKSGNIVLRSVGGQVQYKTKFHFQKLSLDFYGQPTKFEITQNRHHFAQVVK